MARLILPRRFVDQPQHAVELASAFAHPDARAFIGGQRRIIGADYSHAGTILEDVTPGGVSNQSGSAASYINAGRAIHAQPGRHVLVAQFVATDTVMRYVSSTVSDGTAYIEDVRINSTQSETTGTGRVAFVLRSPTGAVLHAATTGVVHGVGDVCTMVWSIDSTTTLSCAVNGVAQPLVYNGAGPYTASEVLSQYPFDLLNRNIRGAHNSGTGVWLSMWARLPLAGLDIESLSGDPWQLFRAELRRIYFDLGAGGGDSTGTLDATEVGADTSAISGSILVSGSLSAAESGADTASIAGSATGAVSGSLAANEAGDDAASVSGAVLVQGALAATESGADTAAIAGATLVQGTLAAAESGADTASIAGDVIVQGSLDATETGADTASFTSETVSSGSLAATETGDDTASMAGVVLVSGSISATEFVTDSAAIAGEVLVQGSLAATEVGSDTAAFSGDTPAAIVGSLAAQESGADSASLSGAVQGRGSAAITETGADTAIVVGTVRITGAFAATESGADTAAFSELAFTYSPDRTLLIADENRVLVLDAQNRILAV